MSPAAPGAGKDAGRALGSRYLLVERIGQGASGEVWRARDRQDDRDVAAKLLWPQHAADPEILTRFINERSVLLALDHPHVVRVHDFVVEGQDLAIVMDLIEGPSLADVLAERATLPPEVAVALVATVLDALDSAHRTGVVHRDVKPDNIMLARTDRLNPQDVLLADFGIAGIVVDEAAPTTELIGTPTYMPPELVSYGKCGPASDVYAAGVVLYQLLAGRTPFAGPGTNVTVAMRQVSAAPLRLPVHDRLWRVLSTMLSKDPGERLSAAGTAALLRRLPASALGSEALPVQPQPDDWTDSPTRLPEKAQVERVLGGSDRGRAGAQTGSGPEDDGADPEATSLRAGQPLVPRSPVKATAEPLLADADSGATMMKAASLPEVATSARRPAATGMSSRAKALIGIAAAVAVVGVGVVLWATGVFTSDGADEEVEITTAAAHVSGETTATGLRIDLDAAYDQAEQVTGLQVTLSAAPNAPVTGDVLLVLPGLTGGECAGVTESEQVARVRASSDGMDIDCGVKLTDVLLEGGASTTVDVTVDLDLVDAEGEQPDDYREWLEQVVQSTQTGLGQLTGTGFALQRVAGVSVEADSVTLAGVEATPVPYRVYADWPGVDEAARTELFTSETVDGMEVDLLRQLTGGHGLDQVSVTACNGTQAIGIRVLAEQPDSACGLTVGVGALTSTETSFGIRMR